MKRISLLLLVAIFSQILLHAQSAPKREVRAVWLTTAWRLDWPSVTVPAPTGNNEAQREAARATQQAGLLTILDRLEAANFNTIYFQVRPMNDALYRSSIPGVPWSQYISDVRGDDPGWSPLGFLIEHAHARGIEVHAWLNPYRYSSSAANHGTLPTDFAVTHPHWLIDYGARGDSHIRILNPGIPEVRALMADIVEDIITNYPNVDGIILDDYFYVSGTTNAMDDAQFAAYPNGFTTAQRGDWRRNNINMMIRDVQTRINSISPWMQWGVSPAGVAVGNNATVAAYYGVRVSRGSDWQRNGIFASPVAWLRDGTIDYISPQIYWNRNHNTNPYGELAAWWAEVSNQFGRHFFSSLTKTGSTQGIPDGSIPAELLAQALINREVDINGAPGTVLFRANQPVSSTAYNVLRNGAFQLPALTALFGWKPAPMQGLVANINVSGRNVSWDYTPNGDFGVRYVIYAVPNANRDDADAFTSPRFLEGVSYTTSFTLRDGISAETHNIAVAVFDRFGNLFPVRVLGEDETTVAPVQLTFPAHEQMGVPATADFTWQANDADFYVWQLAEDACFTRLLASREIIEPNAGLNFIDAQRAANGQCFIKPNTRYFWRVKSIKANAPVSVSEVRAFNGVPTTYTIAFNEEGSGTLTASINDVAISTGAQVWECKNVIFTATPNEGYQIKAWRVNGTVVANHTENTYTHSNLEADITVTVVFEAIYAVNFNVVAGSGRLTAAIVNGDEITTGDKVPEGSEIVFTAEPEANYVVQSWTVDGTVVADHTENTYTHLNLDANLTVMVTFARQTGVGNIFSSVQVFPNPFSDVMHIAGAENSMLQVVNVLGTVVYSRQITDANEDVNLSQLPAGVYFFRLEGDGQTKTIKAVKR